MYPTLSDLTKDVFGFGIPLPIKMFGLFVAIAFGTAMVILKRELLRRERADLLKPYREITLTGEPVSYINLTVAGIIAIASAFFIIEILKNEFPIIQKADELRAIYGITLADTLIALIFSTIVICVKYHKSKVSSLVRPEVKIIDVWPHERTDSLIAIAAVAGLAGAKLFDAFENWHSYITEPSNFLAFSGLTFYGGLIVATIAILYYAHQKQIDKWQLADSAAPALMLAYGIGRIGCHMAGDGDWGIANTFQKPMQWLPDWFWSYTYPHNVSEQGILMPGCTGQHCFQLPQGVFPTSLYEFVVCALLFFVLWKLRKNMTSPGRLFGVYLIMNGAERFLIELIRVNNRYDLGFIHPTQAELISTALLICGFAVIFTGKKQALSKNGGNQFI